MGMSITGLSAMAVLDLAKNGHVLFCPTCGSVLKTLPEGLPNGSLPVGITCPASQRHYIIYREPAKAMQAVRDSMEKMVTETNKQNGND